MQRLGQQAFRFCSHLKDSARRAVTRGSVSVWRSGMSVSHTGDADWANWMNIPTLRGSPSSSLKVQFFDLRGSRSVSGIISSASTKTDFSCSERTACPCFQKPSQSSHKMHQTVNCGPPLERSDFTVCSCRGCKAASISSDLVSPLH